MLSTVMTCSSLLLCSCQHYNQTICKVRLKSNFCCVMKSVETCKYDSPVCVWSLTIYPISCFTFVCLWNFVFVAVNFWLTNLTSCESAKRNCNPFVCFTYGSLWTTVCHSVALCVLCIVVESIYVSLTCSWASFQQIGSCIITATRGRLWVSPLLKAFTEICRMKIASQTHKVENHPLALIYSQISTEGPMWN